MYKSSKTRYQWMSRPHWRPTSRLPFRTSFNGMALRRSLRNRRHWYMISFLCILICRLGNFVSSKTSHSFTKIQPARLSTSSSCPIISQPQINCTRRQSLLRRPPPQTPSNRTTSITTSLTSPATTFLPPSSSCKIHTKPPKSTF